MYSDADLCPVYCHECWMGDGWDAKTYAMDIDWNVPFLQQFNDLFKKTPRNYQYRGGTLVNSDYSNYTLDNKNVYLAFSVIGCEDIQYSENIDKSKNSFDCLGAQQLDNCSWNVDCLGNFNCHYAIRSQSCIDSYFVANSANCQNCCLSTNIRKQSYIFENQQLTKEEYKKRFDELQLHTREGLEKAKKRFEELCKNSVVKYSNIVNSQDATGDFINNSRMVHNSFDVQNSENVSNGNRILSCKDCYDCYGILTGELEYEGVACSIQSYGALASFICLTSKNMKYSALCRNCSDCFGCSNIKNAQYCILNKQYTKEEYEELVPKLIKHMNDMPYVDAKGRVYAYGEYFPYEFCPFTYNESVVQDYFPITEAIASEKGYPWKPREKRTYAITMLNNQIPNDINAVSEDIFGQVIECAHKGECGYQCTTAFKITPDELQFLKQKKLPLPTLCPNCRHFERVGWRNSMHLWIRKCMCDLPNHDHQGVCQHQFETSYAPDRLEKVYCEQCYQKEVM